MLRSPIYSARTTFRCDSFKTLAPGGREGHCHSQALVGIDHEGQGIEVRTMPWETAVIENESSAPSPRGSTDAIPADDDD